MMRIKDEYDEDGYDLADNQFSLQPDEPEA